MTFKRCRIQPMRTETRFAFGENWNSFSNLISEERIEAAKSGLKRLFPEGLSGKSLIDIGCGSGLSMVAALRLGAESVYGIDLDPQSVETSNKVLSSYAADGRWSVDQKSVFDLDGNEKYDIVYSWGVLHHTGDMNRAIRRAASLVNSNGVLAISLYRRTMLCPAWTIEKKIYASSPPLVQKAIYSIFKVVLSLKGAQDTQIRGMDFDHDIHDWLGGYPYESAPPSEVISMLKQGGFYVQHIDPGSPRIGLFGATCNEYVAKLTAPLALEQHVLL